MPQEDNFIPNTDYKNPSGESYPVGVNGRIDFSKISGNLALPNLVEIQTDSYQQFLEKGIDEVLADAFPIPHYNKDMFVDGSRSPGSPLLNARWATKLIQAS